MPADYDLIYQSNDHFVKGVFSDPAQATALFRKHLPAAIAEQIDWPSLRLEPGSFVKQNLRQAHSDLLYSVILAERKVCLYLVFEHQTTVDPSMPLRLLGYVSEILRMNWDRHGPPLPPVIGFVMHQGPEEWTVSEQFSDLFDLPDHLGAALGPYLPQFRHALLDLSRFDPSKEEDDEQLQVILQLMKLAREKRVAEFFMWLDGLRQVVERLPREFLRLMILYALNVDSDLDVERITHKIISNPQLREVTMSAAEKLIAKGRVEGRMEGRVQGTWIGKLQALQEMMGLTVTPSDELQQVEVPELERRYLELQKAYAAQFKS